MIETPAALCLVKKYIKNEVAFLSLPRLQS